MDEVKEAQSETVAATRVPWFRNKLLHLVLGSVLVAFMLVFASMALYESSGAAQLDLSRPGFKSVQGQVNQNDSFESFSADGTVDQKVISDFQKLYDKQTSRVDSSDVFSSVSLSDAALQIDAPKPAK